MAESVVSFAVETIGNLLTNEAKILWGMESQVEDLQKELKLIQCLLRDADSRREHNQAVGEWVAQLRDIAHDAEDVIEQYILRVASKKGQNIIISYAFFVAKCTMQVHGVGRKIEGLKSSISNLRMNMQGSGIQIEKPVNEEGCPNGENKKIIFIFILPKKNYIFILVTEKLKILAFDFFGKSTKIVLNLLYRYQFNHKLFNWTNLVLNLFTLVPIQSIRLI
ncbi:hypothetical protein ACJRO7_027683 [Eucalyptus globulus]|uniref:Disease resistance N-terminal domain-containing protein n=1 Tax=Eucalyptus globulus TaxID=34317 RepID=A0ABD3JSS9_EUCGL